VLAVAAPAMLASCVLAVVVAVVGVEPNSSYIFPVAESYLTFCGLAVVLLESFEPACFSILPEGIAAALLFAPYAQTGEATAGTFSPSVGLDAMTAGCCCRCCCCCCCVAVNGLEHDVDEDAAMAAAALLSA